MKILDQYFSLQKQIHEYFDYTEDWKVIPLEDARQYYWTLYENENGSGFVRFAESIEELHSDDGEYYENSIYTQRFLPKWVYRGEDYTMICVDTNTDGNKFLQIFDNVKEVRNEE